MTGQPISAPGQADIEAALVLLSQLGMSPRDLAARTQQPAGGPVHPVTVDNAPPNRSKVAGGLAALACAARLDKQCGWWLEQTGKFACDPLKDGARGLFSSVAVMCAYPPPGARGPMPSFDPDRTPGSICQDGYYERLVELASGPDQILVCAEFSTSRSFSRKVGQRRLLRL